jgi:formyltetrahydrofolate deformylase
VAGVSGFLYRHNANIIHADQHRDNDAGLFFMRVEWALDEFDLSREAFAAEFGAEIGAGMNWSVSYSAERPSVAVFVSRQLHCLADLLHRHQSGELACDIRLIAGNHEDARPLAGFYGIPFHFIPAGPDMECRQLELLAGIDLLVLARYMQILSPAFVARFPNRIINVHHSFLPAFSGARPYHAAHRRGVKLIGATSHYVTDVLDDGPIIEQDVMRVSHRDQLEDLIQKGRDLERMVLSRAVRWHLERRILCFCNKTVVFD